MWVHGCGGDCVGSIPYMGDLFALRALSPPPCTYIYCISLCGFQFTAWSPHSHVPTFTVFPCTGSIPYMSDLFALRALSPPSHTYIHCMGFNSLCGSPPLPCFYIHCISLHGSLHSLHAPQVTFV